MAVHAGEIEVKIIDTVQYLTALNGVNNVSLALLSKYLGFSKSNIYNYFSSKDQIFEHLVQRQIIEFRLVSEEFKNDSNTELYLEKIIDYLLEGSAFKGIHTYVLLVVLQEYISSPTIKNKVVQLFSEIQESLKRAVILKTNYPESLSNEVAKDIFSMICGEIILAHANGNYEGLNDLYRRADNYIQNFHM